MTKHKKPRPRWVSVAVDLTPTFLQRLDQHAAAMGVDRDELLREACVAGLHARVEAWRSSETVRRAEAKKRREARQARARAIVRSAEGRPRHDPTA